MMIFKAHRSPATVKLPVLMEIRELDSASPDVDIIMSEARVWRFRVGARNDFRVRRVSPG